MEISLSDIGYLYAPNLYVIDDFLPEHIFVSLQRFAKKTPLPRSQKTLGWPKNLVEDSKEVKISKPLHDTSPIIIRLLLEKLKTLSIFSKYPNESFGFLVYSWGEGSYIPVHNDHNKEFSIVLHLSENWNPRWGGILTTSPFFPDEKEKVCVSPKRNRLVIIKGGVSHQTSVILGAQEERLIIQSFCQTFHLQNN